MNTARQGEEIDSRLGGLAAAGLASRFTSSHLDGILKAKVQGRWLELDWLFLMGASVNFDM